ncbi:MAG TPA: amino acid adenylation domain-containing protein, partial [Candidatus Binatia bacterium]|nr:amino acid adenylation domain-containing protein [Candidatus Binatia bacterium]
LRRSHRNDEHGDGFVKGGLRVLVSLENALDPSPAWTRLHTKELQTSLKFVPYDLGFRFVESADELLVDCIYNTDLFERASAQRWLARMKCLLEAIVANPDAHIADLAVMPESERAQVVRDWNTTDVSFPLDRSYTGFFEARAGAMPNAPAVRHRDREWSYAELNRCANRIAHYLQDAGIGPEAVVGVCMDRSLDLAAVLLGVLKAGAAYLPLDPAYPQERLDYMISDSGARLLLTQSAIAPRFASQSINMFSNDDPAFVRKLEQSEWDRNFPCPATASSLAYVIYTSGSTGKSKGVEITRRSLLNHNLAMARIFGLSPADRVLQFTALSFDISVEEMFPSWLSGCAVIMRSEQALASMPEFFRFVEQERISILNMPTAFWHTIVDALPRTPLPACLRLAVIGGEKASLQHYLKWQQHAGDRIKLINTYGPTETTVTASVYIPGADARQTVFPIGRPIANTRMYVLDERQQPVPIGVPGELYIGGEGVARGYLNRPELNAERFLTNSFTSAPERMYKTGDLVRYLHDGNIEFVGRADNQIKIRGFRVEPGEVEAVLLKHPHVRQCVVAARPHGENEKRLVAWFVPTAGTQPTAGEITSFLKKDLPDYMIPFACVPVKGLPLLPNGKVDQASLPSSGDVRPELEQAFVAPQTPLEETIAGIWSEVLGVKNIGIHDNFFELGGHSLHAMQVVTRLRDFLRTDVPMTTLFHASTIAALVGLLTAAGRERKSNSGEPIPRTPLQGNAPLSFAQQRLWFLHQLEPNSPVYNVPQLVRIEGMLDTSALESAFLTVLTRHEALRTHFIMTDGEPRQEIASITRFPLPVVDLRSLTDEARQSELKELANQ